MRKQPIKRKTGEKYTCAYCGAKLTHDEAYRHASFECPQRPKGLGKR